MMCRLKELRAKVRKAAQAAGQDSSQFEEKKVHSPQSVSAGHLTRTRLRFLQTEPSYPLLEIPDEQLSP
jgi:hypothetical protein